MGSFLPEQPPRPFHHPAEDVYKSLGDAADGVEQQGARADGSFAVVQAAVQTQGKIRKILHVDGKVAVQGVVVEVDPAAALYVQTLAFEIKITSAHYTLGDAP